MLWDNSMAGSYFSALKNEPGATSFATSKGSTAAGAVTPRSDAGGPTKTAMDVNSQPWQRRRIHSAVRNPHGNLDQGPPAFGYGSGDGLWVAALGCGTSPLD